MVAYWRKMERLCIKYWSKDGDLTVEEAEEIESGRRFPSSEKLRCSDNVCLWYRIERLVSKIEDLPAIADLIIQGDELGIRSYYRQQNKTRNQLVEEARSLNVPYYGRLTKKELQKAIQYYKKYQVTRQKFEREAKRSPTI